MKETCAHAQTNKDKRKNGVCLFVQKKPEWDSVAQFTTQEFFGSSDVFFLDVSSFVGVWEHIASTPHVSRLVHFLQLNQCVSVCVCVCLIYLSSEGEVEEQGSESFWERERDKKGMGMRWFVCCTIAVTEALLCGKRRWMDEKAITGLVFRESGSLWNKVEIDSTGERNLIHRKGKRVFIVCITNFVCGHWISCTRGRGDGLLRMELSKDHKKH